MQLLLIVIFSHVTHLILPSGKVVAVIHGPWRKSLWGGLSVPLLLITGPGVPNGNPAF